MNILKKSCYDCHSNETKWSEYAYIAPLSFGVVSHVKDARKALNFSNYKNIDKEIKIARLKKAIHTLKLNTMPLASYLEFHKEAKLTKEDKSILINWCNLELKKLTKNSEK
jgi:anthranilate/para-aminobenzoate synthase component II